MTLSHTLLSWMDYMHGANGNLCVQVLQYNGSHYGPATFPPYHGEYQHQLHSSNAYENQPPPPQSVHQVFGPPLAPPAPLTIHERRENVDYPTAQFNQQHQVTSSENRQAQQQADYHHQSRGPFDSHQQQGMTMPEISRYVTPHRHQDIMGKMHLSQSDPAFKSPLKHSRGGLASTPTHPPVRWYSEDPNYLSECPVGQLRYHQQALVHPGQQLQYGGAPGYARQDQKGIGANPRVSPSESLPARIQSMSIREQEFDNSDEEEGIVTKEVHQVAAEVIEETSAQRDIKTDIHKPLDPNLVCPTCKKQFRIGEIQKLRRHAKDCYESK